MSASAETEDIEIVMHLYRLMRSGNYKTADEVLKAACADFKDVPEKRVRECAARLARKLIEA